MTLSCNVRVLDQDEVRKNLLSDDDAGNVVYEEQFNHHMPWTPERIRSATRKLLALSKESESTRDEAIANDDELRHFKDLHPIT
eukprot:6185268-Pleurochrysis_carterae.AAC.1